MRPEVAAYRRRRVELVLAKLGRRTLESRTLQHHLDMSPGEVRRVAALCKATTKRARDGPRTVTTYTFPEPGSVPA